MNEQSIVALALRGRSRASRPQCVTKNTPPRDSKVVTLIFMTSDPSAVQSRSKVENLEIPLLLCKKTVMLTLFLTIHKRKEKNTTTILDDKHWFMAKPSIPSSSTRWCLIEWVMTRIRDTGNTCKFQLYFVKIVRNMLLFCQKLLEKNRYWLFYYMKFPLLTTWCQ